MARLFGRRQGKKGVDWDIGLQTRESENAFLWFLGQRGFSAHRLLAFVIGVLNLSMVTILIYCVVYGSMEIRILRSTILTFFLVLSFLMFPLGKKSWKEPFGPLFLLDVALICLAVAIQVYTLAHIDRFTWEIAPLSFWEAFFGVALLILVAESARRTMGLLFCGICVFFLLQPMFSHYLPGILYGPPIDYEQVIEQQFLRDDGIFGLALGVMVSTLSLFLIFGAFLQKTSASQFFISLAQSIAGRFSGGTAKIAVVSSAFMGSISGSVTANVATTGSVTIPMMKKSGYPSEFAAGVEAVASSGGQLMPPIMGISAFLIAAIMGIPYFEVCKHALIPAVLYFTAVFMVVHLRARKMGLKPLDADEVPSTINVFRDGGFLAIPVAAIVYLLIRGYSAEKAVITSLALVFVLSFIRPQTRLSPKGLLDALETGGRIMIPIGIACASVGLIIGSLGASGLATRFTSFVVEAAGGQLWVALLYSMIAAMILGMGVPTAVVYVFLAVLIVPALVQMGVEPIAAHLFVFYFGVIGNITPPFALASFTAAAIAGANLMKTGFTGVAIGLASFIIPFAFAYSPQLLFVGSPLEVLTFALPALVGIWALPLVTEGWAFRPMKLLTRAVLFFAAIALIKPGLLTDAFGFVVVATIVISQWRARKYRPGTVSTS
ncbi:MAG: TRAP transporter fused permease subunit [Deltaproteobacteria bacterium]|nr:TRAP transporter fused permease subunit [Deltaproteobacteria bacterium]